MFLTYASCIVKDIMSNTDIKHIPNFNLATTKGNMDLYTLCGEKGLVIYFYPKDMTPGCTKQACDYREAYDDIVKEGWNIVGVSADDLDSHNRFIQKYKLPFILISDAQHTLSEHLSMWVDKLMFGKKYKGMQRSICMMNCDGDVVKIWRKVSIISHKKNLLKYIREINVG